jgi:hypothetical protein
MSFQFIPIILFLYSPTAIFAANGRTKCIFIFTESNIPLLANGDLLPAEGRTILFVNYLFSFFIFPRQRRSFRLKAAWNDILLSADYNNLGKRRMINHSLPKAIFFLVLFIATLLFLQGRDSGLSLTFA